MSDTKMASLAGSLFMVCAATAQARGAERPANPNVARQAPPGPDHFHLQQDGWDRALAGLPGDTGSPAREHRG